jgi:polysaccharide export outer membrane protein
LDNKGRYKKNLYLFFIIIFFSFAGPSTLSAEEDTPYIIGPEDILEISVWKDPELTKQIIVRPDGKISFPLIGEIKAGGQTVKSLEKELKKRLSEYIPDAMVTVMVIQVNSIKIYVIGKVGRSGEYTIGRSINVMQALSLAGGLSTFADADSIVILRREKGSQIKIPFNYKEVKKGINLEQNILLQGGDILVVPPGEISLFGGQARLIPRITITETYNDNINLSTIEEKDDLISIISPSLKSNHQTERTQTTADVELDVIRYSKEDNLNKVNQKYSIGFDFRVTELIGLNFNGSLIKDTTLDTEMQETGLVLKRSDRDFYNVRPGISWNLTKATSINLNLGYSNAQYEDPDYSDYKIYNETLELVHAISKQGTTAFAQGGHAHYDYETSDIDNYRLHLGLTYPFSERLKLTAWAGARYTESEYDVVEWEPVYWQGTPIIMSYRLVRRTELKRNWGWLIYFALTKTLTHGSVSMSINRDITPSGRGETIERDRVILGLDYRFTEFITGRFSGSWSRSRSESQYRETDEQFYTLRPSLSWQIMEHTVTELSYQYTRIENMNTGTHGDRNIILLSFNIHWEKLI